jgi:hypothetical protein
MLTLARPTAIFRANDSAPGMTMIAAHAAAAKKRADLPPGRRNG